MEELKVHNQHVILWKFKNNKNATKTAQKISSVYEQGVIITIKSKTGFQSFILMICHWEMNPY